MGPGLKQEILSILDDANDMTIATVREDGYPQATTVSYVNDGLAIYFGCAANSQKAKNLARDSKVSLTVNYPTQAGTTFVVCRSAAGRSVSPTLKRWPKRAS
jgi:nitroimidazol reductase NimA-like FMN-containing flavoprotein (pyridoxamine 5'-phosphate oxidase superfamily)